MRAMHEEYDPDRDILLFAAHVYVTGAKMLHSSQRAGGRRLQEPALRIFREVAYAALGQAPIRWKTVRGAKCIARYAGKSARHGLRRSRRMEERRGTRRRRPRTTGKGVAPPALQRPILAGPLPRDPAGVEGRGLAQYDGTFLKAVIAGEEPDGLPSQENIGTVLERLTLADLNWYGKVAAEAVMDGDSRRGAGAPRRLPRLPGIRGAERRRRPVYRHRIHPAAQRARRRHAAPGPGRGNAPRCAGKHLDGGVVKPSRLIVSGMRSDPAPLHHRLHREAPGSPSWAVPTSASHSP